MVSAVSICGSCAIVSILMCGVTIKRERRFPQYVN